MFAGRSEAVKQKVAKTIMALAQPMFSPSGNVVTEITLEVGKLDNDNYYKVIVNQ
ncbi:5-carboxymethyl-2-hydroxymuconate isomerase [Pragia fontium]|nr:5-carboxymethyl-2-hydroxymuconate isomerase [Pragia fontium]